MKSFALSFAIVSTIALSGCSALAEPSTTPTSSPVVASMTPAEAKATFEQIATESCEKAMAEGVVEQSTSSDGFTLVMVPKDEAYLDFSAAYFEADDIYELIWEVDAFSSCGAAISFALAEESGGESDLQVTFNPTDSTFETFQDLGEYGTNRLKYEINAGLLSKIEVLDSTVVDIRTISYGNLQETDWNILRTAVDRYLEEK